MVYIDCARQVVLRGFLDGRLTLTTPISNPPSQHDTAPIAETPITSISSGYCTQLTPIQVRGKGPCVGIFTHPISTTHTHHKHTLTQSYSSHLLVLHNTCHCLPVHRQICATLSRRRRCITTAQALQKYNNALPQFLCLEDSFQTDFWAADAEWPMSVLTV